MAQSLRSIVFTATALHFPHSELQLPSAFQMVAACSVAVQGVFDNLKSA